MEFAPTFVGAFLFCGYMVNISGYNAQNKPDPQGNQNVPGGNGLPDFSFPAHCAISFRYCWYSASLHWIQCPGTISRRLGLSVL